MRVKFWATLEKIDRRKFCMLECVVVFRGFFHFFHIRNFVFVFVFWCLTGFNKLWCRERARILFYRSFLFFPKQNKKTKFLLLLLFGLWIFVLFLLCSDCFSCSFTSPNWLIAYLIYCCVFVCLWYARMWAKKQQN